MKYWPAGSARGPRADLRHALRMVVDQHQVEVGAGHHFPPARLAEQHHRHRAAAHPAEALREIGEHRPRQRGQRGIGQRGAAQPGGIGVDPPLQRGDRDGEILLPHGAADDRDGLLQPGARRPAGRAAAVPGRPARRHRRSSPSSAPGWVARCSASEGAAPSTAATPFEQAGLRWNSDRICTPAGSRARSASKRAKAASGCGWRASAASSAGSSRAISSRARSERSARTRPASQPRTAWRSGAPARRSRGRQRGHRLRRRRVVAAEVELAARRLAGPSGSGTRSNTVGVARAHPLERAAQRRGRSRPHRRSP